MTTRYGLEKLIADRSQSPAFPWNLPPRFDVKLRSPLDGDEWRWRILPPGHPAISQEMGFLRQGDSGDALKLISEKYGTPEGYCVVAGKVVSVSNWEGISIADQYAAVAQGAGAFPCGTMRYLSIEGSNAARVLNLLTPRHVDGLQLGQAALLIFTTPEGTVDTEAVIIRDGERSFRMSVGGEARPPTWLAEAISAHTDVHVQEANLSSFNLKGPNRLPAMARLVGEDSASELAALRPFRCVRVTTRSGRDAWILRTTVGMEMWASPEVINSVWREMLMLPDLYTPCGWDILATYRLECLKFPFYICPIDIHRNTHIFDAGLNHVASRQKRGPFVGKKALEDADARGERMWIGGLVAVSAAVSARWMGQMLFDEISGNLVGYVTSSAYSPQAGRQLCFAHFSASIHPDDVVCCEDRTRWRVKSLPISPSGTT
jgi:aminomethyltransferase